MVDEAIALGKEARRTDDLGLVRHALELRRRGERRGGQLLALGKPSHPDLGEHQEARWRAAAETSDEVFEASLKRLLARQVVGAHPGGSPPGIKMHISKWSRDDLGILSRTIEAADPVSAAGQVQVQLESKASGPTDRGKASL